MSTMTFQFLDVGMGDGTLVQLRPTGQRYDTLILFDFGEEKSTFKNAWKDAFIYLQQTIEDNSLLRKPNTPFIDYLFISHSDADHHNKLLRLCDALPKLRFDRVYFGGRKVDYPENLITGLEKRSNEVNEMHENFHSAIKGNTVKPDFQIVDINAYVLSVNFPDKNANANPKSIVLMFELGKDKVILQGDAEALTEAAIVKHFASVPGFLESTALKLGHHGSKNGTCLEWVKAVKPKAIFASADFVWRHPYCEAICRVRNAKTLIKVPQQWYCCGDDADYFNNVTEEAVCINLWYYVKTAKGEKLIDDQSGPVWASAGWTYGVQWTLTLDGSGTPDLMVSDAAAPSNEKKIPPGWNC